MWHVLQAAPIQPRRVAQRLEERQVSTTFPRFPRFRQDEGRQHADRRERCVFSGYLFFRFAPGIADWQKVCRTPGVWRLLLAAGQPGVVADAVIERLQKRLREGLSGRPARRFVPGESVVIERGRRGRHLRPCAAALDGPNFMEFRADGVSVRPVELPDETLRQLQDRLMLFSTGRRGDSAAILEEQKRSSERNRASVIAALHGIRDSATALRKELLNGNVAAIATALDVTWAHKRELAHGLSDPWIDDWYPRARSAGAAGGQLASAGGGGFLLLYCEPEGQERLTRTLGTSGLTRMDFHFEAGGATLVVNKFGGAPGGVPSTVRTDLDR